uniref:Basic helix-loop-helix ARNT like 2 n=1 Tax=Seriola dumerili TaxID=41447 RepID=A0A3B4UT08_SERDU
MEHLTSQQYGDLQADVFLYSLSHPRDGCFHVSDPAEEEKGQASQAGPSLPAVELPRKRKGIQQFNHLQFKICSIGLLYLLDITYREPHRQIEKRRRDKMNNLIDELSAMIPACQPMARKLDKLTVLRKAVQHLKALKGITSPLLRLKSSYLPTEQTTHVLIKQICRWDSQVELTGQSLFDFIHPKDINKVKEQLSSSEMYPRQRLIDAATGAQVQADSPARVSHLSTGSRRSFFCRMKHSRVTGKQEEKRSLPSISKKKDTYRYCTLHCTGYMRSWPSSQLDPEGDSEKEPNLTCLVMVCRLHPHVPHHPSKDINVKPTEFITRCAIDGKFTFVDQQATTVIGYLPQEVLGTSCYEYFHQDDLQHLAEKHRQVLRSKEKIETQCYKFKTKYGSYVSLQSQWFNFTNPWTKEVEFIVSSNRVISGPGHTKDDEEAGSSKALQEDTKHIPVIPGLSSGLGPMIYAGSIGTQIANELIDSYRLNSSPSSGASSPFGPVQEKCPLVSPNTSRSVSDLNYKTAHHRQIIFSSLPSTLKSCFFGLFHPGEPSQLDLDSMVVPGLSSFSSDEAAMAVIMSLLETDVNMGQSGDFEDLHWPF